MQRKTSPRSLSTWLAEIGDRAMLCLAAENGRFHSAAREREVVERAAEARMVAWARARHEMTGRNP